MIGDADSPLQLWLQPMLLPWQPNLPHCYGQSNPNLGDEPNLDCPIPDCAEDKIGEPENEDGKGEEEGSGGEEGEGTGCGQGAEGKEGEVEEDKNGEGDDRIVEEEVVVVAEPTAVAVAAGEEARARETKTGKDGTGTGRETMELAVWEGVVAVGGGDGGRPWRVAVVS